MTPIELKAMSNEELANQLVRIMTNGDITIDTEFVLSAVNARLRNSIPRPVVTVETEGGTWYYVVVNGKTVRATESEEKSNYTANALRTALGLSPTTEQGKEASCD